MGTPPVEEMASSGQCSVEWGELKGALSARLTEVCEEYYAANKDIDSSGETFSQVLQRLQLLLNEFPNAPFTVQRLCELLLDPHRVYRTSTRKVMSALEKLLTVSSTVPTMSTTSAKPGTYQVAAEYELTKLLNGEQGGEAQPMDVEN